MLGIIDIRKICQPSYLTTLKIYNRIFILTTINIVAERKKKSCREKRYDLSVYASQEPTTETTTNRIRGSTREEI